MIFYTKRDENDIRSLDKLRKASSSSIRLFRAGGAIKEDSSSLGNNKALNALRVINQFNKK